MKKLMLLLICVIGTLLFANAQNDTVLYIENYQDGDRIPICVEMYTTVSIYPENGCNDGFRWVINDIIESWDNPLVIESNTEELWLINYYGCNFQRTIRVDFRESRVPSSFSHTTWKRSTGTLTLEAVGQDSVGWPFNYYTFLWSTGETTRTIDVADDIVYDCEINDPCGTAIRTFPVRNNVEIELATCDLESNLNMLTWPVTARQSQYIDHLNVKRDGMIVGTADYSAGYYIDNIGSDAAARTYTLIAVATDGTECPIESYPKETIHMSYTLGVNNTIEVGWNSPNGYDLLGYNICEWHPGKNGKDGDLTVIDYVGAGVNNYTCSESQFDSGNVVVQGVEAGKTESRLLSNRSWETVGVNEQIKQNFQIYPNPSNGQFTVEGAKDLTIVNLWGQIVSMSHSENGIHHISISVAPGTYFVKGGGSTQKVVVIPQ